MMLLFPQLCILFPLVANACLTGILGCSQCEANCDDGVSYCAVPELCLNDHVGGCDSSYTTTQTATAFLISTYIVSDVSTETTVAQTVTSYDLTTTTTTVDPNFSIPPVSTFASFTQGYCYQTDFGIVQSQETPTNGNPGGIGPQTEVYLLTTSLASDAPQGGRGGAGTVDCEGTTAWSVYYEVTTVYATATPTIYDTSKIFTYSVTESTFVETSYEVSTRSKSPNTSSSPPHESSSPGKGSTTPIRESSTPTKGSSSPAPSGSTPPEGSPTAAGGGQSPSGENPSKSSPSASRFHPGLAGSASATGFGPSSKQSATVSYGSAKPTISMTIETVLTGSTGSQSSAPVSSGGSGPSTSTVVVGNGPSTTDVSRQSALET